MSVEVKVSREATISLYMIKRAAIDENLFPGVENHSGLSYSHQRRKATRSDPSAAPLTKDGRATQMAPSYISPERALAALLDCFLLRKKASAGRVHEEL